MMAKESLMKLLDICVVMNRLVPDSGITYLQAIFVAGGLNKVRRVLRHVWGIKLAIADPAGRAPGKDVENDVGIALVRLDHEPPLVAARVVVVVAAAHMAR